MIGDTGTGEPAEYQVGQQMVAFRQKFPFSFLLMLGDNIYPDGNLAEVAAKFERPYAGFIRSCTHRHDPTIDRSGWRGLDRPHGTA